jgi:membrane-bound lytic murein transglycosylase D
LADILIKNDSMNKIKFIAKLFAMVMISLTFTSTEALAEEKDLLSAEATSMFQDRMNYLGSEFDFKVTPEVQKLINLYLGRHKYGSEKLLGRSGIYFPLIEQRIKDKNLPEELKYIPIIESSLKPYAKSKVGAAGLWQFMYNTGRMMGLKITSVVDERNDPIKSTYAALDYLEMLYDQFDDWTLAIAAYNCGPGNVRKAIRKADSRNFWEIIPYLPKETRRYVPKFIATTYVMTYYAMHDLNPIMDELEENPTTAKVYESLSFRKLAKFLDMDVKSIKQMNPAYLKGYIPKSDEGNHITLPEEKLELLSYELETLVDIIYQPIERPKPVEEIAEEEELEKIPFTREILEIPILLNGDTLSISYVSSDQESNSGQVPSIMNNEGVRRNKVMTLLTIIDRKTFLNDSDFHHKHLSPKIEIHVDLE